MKLTIEIDDRIISQLVDHFADHMESLARNCVREDIAYNQKIADRARGATQKNGFCGLNRAEFSAWLIMSGIRADSLSGNRADFLSVGFGQDSTPSYDLRAWK